MKKVNFKRNALMAGFWLASALAFSCSSESGEGIEHSSLIDERDGERYKTVIIGNKEWMAENLRYNSINNGNSYCDASSNDCGMYGMFYDWAAAMNVRAVFNSNKLYFEEDYDDFEPHKGICPQGWHIPNDAEWNALITAVGGLSKSAAKLKSVKNWDKNGNGTDDYGFAALPGGYVDYNSSAASYNSKLVGEAGIWWSLTESTPATAYGRKMESESDFVSWGPESKTRLFSVRCTREHQKETENSGSGGSSNPPFIDDRDSKVYDVVDIGSQTWMAENLDYRGEKNDIGACYDKEPENCDKYGRLYGWEEAIIACPVGWHLPSEYEWYVLLNEVGEPSGKQLKSKSGWEKNGNGTDSYGFKALPGGGGLPDKFNAAGHSGIWWSATEIGISASVNLYINNNRNDVGWDSQSKQYLFSVRCIKD